MSAARLSQPQWLKPRKPKSLLVKTEKQIPHHYPRKMRAARFGSGFWTPVESAGLLKPEMTARVQR